MFGRCSVVLGVVKRLAGGSFFRESDEGTTE